MSENLMTMAAFARARGVSQRAVHKAVAEGRITESVIQAGGKIKIDASIANREWDANTRAKKPRETQPVSPPINAKDFNAARAKKEAYNAELARLEYEEKEGALIRADDVRKQAFTTARQVRDGLLNIPDRVASELAAIDDRFEIHRRLTEEIRKALETALGGDE